MPTRIIVVKLDICKLNPQKIKDKVAEVADAFKKVDPVSPVMVMPYRGEMEGYIQIELMPLP